MCPNKEVVSELIVKSLFIIIPLKLNRTRTVGNDCGVENRPIFNKYAPKKRYLSTALRFFTEFPDKSLSKPNIG